MHMDSPTRTLALIQMEIGPDSKENLNKALGRTERALKDGANIVCLPELFRSRYFPQQIGSPTPLAETIPGESTKAFALLARQYEAVIIVPVFERGSGSGTRRSSSTPTAASMPLLQGSHPVQKNRRTRGSLRSATSIPASTYGAHTGRPDRRFESATTSGFPELPVGCPRRCGYHLYPTAIGNLCENPPGEATGRRHGS